jgi:tetratricopeptide (TPR) repeat protein
MSANPAESQEHHRRGFRLLSESSYQEARDQFLAAIQKNPEWVSPYLGLGQTYFFQENPDLNAATKSFRRVVELKPDWVEGHHWLGAAQEKAGALEDAVKSYREAIRIAPSDTRPLIALGVCLTEMGQFAEAVVRLRSAVALNPPYAVASAHLFLGDAFRGNGELDAACQEWRLVLGLSSDYPDYESAKKEATKRLTEHCMPPQERRHKR